MQASSEFPQPHSQNLHDINKRRNQVPNHRHTIRDIIEIPEEIRLGISLFQLPRHQSLSLEAFRPRIQRVIFHRHQAKTNSTAAM